MNPFARRRAERLIAESRDRELSPNEVAFLDRYPDLSASLQKGNMALDLLKNLDWAEESSGIEFERRVVRRLKNQRTADGIKYWSPALIGAAVAAVALVAALQIITRANELPALNRPAAEARRAPSAVPLDLTSPVQPR